MDKKVINLKCSTGDKLVGLGFARMTWESRAVTRSELARLLVKVAKSGDWRDELHVRQRQVYLGEGLLLVLQWPVETNPAP